jgi:hypothetical protein
MTHTGRPAPGNRMGERPAANSSAGCANCRHPKALHSNGTTECKAFACTAGPDGVACQGFVTAGELAAAAEPAGAECLAS